MLVVGQGLVCSLGYDVVSACAAARAGLSRPTEVPFTVVDADGLAAPAIAHPVPLLGAEFEGDARLIRLLEGALLDLRSRAPEDLLARARVGVALALPSRHRVHTGLDLIGDADDERRTLYEEQLDPIPADRGQGRATAILRRGLQLAELELEPVELASSTLGHPAALDLLEVSRAWLEEGKVDLVLLAGVDSLVTSSELDWLAATDRLKTETYPVGLVPGEAAAVVLLTLPATARRLGLKGDLRIGAVATCTRGTGLLGGAPPDGRGFVEAITRCLRDVRVPDPAWLVCDHNGEEHWARDWGRAIVQLPDHHRIYGSADPWLPAAAFGDVGAAFGSVALCVMARAQARGFAPAPLGLVIAASEGGARTACVVEAVERSDGQRI